MRGKPHPHPTRPLRYLPVEGEGTKERRRGGKLWFPSVSFTAQKPRRGPQGEGWDGGGLSTVHAGALEINVASERLWLLPDRAAYWPRTKTLLIADAHLGKAAAFRRAGIPVPSGTPTRTFSA